jgi:hypothetical protein
MAGGPDHFKAAYISSRDPKEDMVAIWPISLSSGASASSWIRGIHLNWQKEILM